MKYRLMLTLTIVGLLIATLEPAGQVIEQRRRISSEQEKLEALLAANGRLEQRLERLSDPDYLEKIAREELGMVKPGEVSYVIVPAAGPVEEQAPVAKKEPWYSRFGDWIRSLFK